LLLWYNKVKNGGNYAEFYRWKNHKKRSFGAFDSLGDQSKEFVMECVACFHYRNGYINHDNSMGEVKITPKELNDILAYGLNYLILEYSGDS
jgi:hypothetical protein